MLLKFSKLFKFRCVTLQDSRFCKMLLEGSIVPLPVYCCKRKAIKFLPSIFLSSLLQFQIAVCFFCSNIKELGAARGRTMFNQSKGAVGTSAVQIPHVIFRKVSRTDFTFYSGSRGWGTYLLHTHFQVWYISFTSRLQTRQEIYIGYLHVNFAD